MVTFFYFTLQRKHTHSSLRYDVCVCVRGVTDGVDPEKRRHTYYRMYVITVSIGMRPHYGACVPPPITGALVCSLEANASIGLANLSPSLCPSRGRYLRLLCPESPRPVISFARL